jgi:hypothetical protein
MQSFTVTSVEMKTILSCRVSMSELMPVERIERKIHFIREQKVMLDCDLVPLPRTAAGGGETPHLRLEGTEDVFLKDRGGICRRNI